MTSRENLKYFCNNRNCKTLRRSQFELADNPNSTIQVLTEVIIEKNGKKFRKLTCGHYVNLAEFGAVDSASDSLDPIETQEIRRRIGKEMLIGKTPEQREQIILRQVKEYQTMLKAHKKQVQQEKYALQVLQEEIDKHVDSGLLSKEEAQSSKMRLAHAMEQRPASQKTLDRERTTVDKKVETGESVMQKMRAELKKMGIDFGGEKYKELLAAATAKKNTE